MKTKKEQSKDSIDYFQFYENNLDSDYKDNSHRRRFAKITSIIPKVKGRILDLGCGIGKITSLLEGDEIIGCDISENAIKIARKNNSKNKRFIKADARNLPFSDGYFDFIFALDVFEHIPNFEKAISEVHRVLKKDGKLIAIIPNGSGISQKFDKKNIKNNPFHHIHFFSKEDIRDYFKMFKITQWENLTFFPCSPKIVKILLSFWGVLYLLDSQLCKLPLSFGDEWFIVFKK